MTDRPCRTFGRGLDSDHAQQQNWVSRCTQAQELGWSELPTGWLSDCYYRKSEVPLMDARLLKRSTRSQMRLEFVPEKKV